MNRALDFFDVVQICATAEKFRVRDGRDAI